MRTIFLCEKPSTIPLIFGTGNPVYGKDDVCGHPADFADTEFIFSTWGMPEFTEDEIRSFLPKLKAIFYGAGSVQDFARPFLNCGVRVFSAYAANAVPVAEYAAAQIILANKGFFRSAGIKSEEDYRCAADFQSHYTGNYGAKVGILGAGAIGKLVIKLLAPYGLDILVFDPFLPDDAAKELGVQKCSLERIFRECNVISNHIANNPQTKGILSGALFEKMLPYSTFINTGRGAQVVESDLIRVLKARPDITAVLDVTFPEPPEADSALYTLENCILTPHIAGSTGKELQRMGAYMRAEYDNFIQGRPCKYEITLSMLDTMA